jgi:translocation and assembly module TamA
VSERVELSAGPVAVQIPGASTFRSAWRCLLVLLLAGSCASAPAQQPIVGAVVEAPAAVRDLLRTHLSVMRRDLSALDEAEKLQVIRDARREAAALLDTEGYFAPNIEVRTDRAGAGERLVIAVDPGRRARVETVDLQFAGDIAGPAEELAERRRQLREAWTLKPGEPFRQQAWDAAKQAVLQRLVAEDYAAGAIASSAAEVDPEAGTVQLRLVLNSGPPFTLGPLEVSGLERYAPELVLRYSNLKVGERYSQERLLALQGALQNTPYFSSVTVDVENDPEHPERVPVRVQVRESRPKRVTFGVGFSTNTGPRVEASFRHADFLDRAWLLLSGVRIEQKDQLGYADVLLPLGAADYRHSFGVLVERTDIQNLETRRVAVGAVRARSRGRIETRLSLNFQNEIQEPAGQPSEIARALTLSWSWTYRNVDNLLDPRNGYVLNAQVGGAAKALLSDQNFVRLYTRYQHYFPVGERDMFTVRGELGYTAAPSTTGIPQEFLFRTGGTQSVRGYAFQSLGVQQGDAVVGGQVLGVASAEYVHWFSERWGGAAFYDAGNAWDPGEPLRLFPGYGLGARWRSPAGPLALDVAYGQRDSKVRLEFSVAIAF